MPHVTPSSSPSTATVRLSAIRDNTSIMREMCGTPVMAVVKADGFGLGAVRVARAALSGGATELGVATIDEALALREAGVMEPVLAWVLHDGARMEEALAARVRLSLTSRAQVAAVTRLAVKVGVVAEIELEIETGMHRSGCGEADWNTTLDEVRRASESGWVKLIGLWTHLSGSHPEHFTQPLETLERAAAVARGKRLHPRVHAAASLAATIDPRTRLDLVRLGASLFGIEPVRSRPVGLRAVVRWESRVTRLHDVPAGSLVGYGRARIERPTQLALIPIGYADGLPRRSSPGLGAVTKSGHLLPFVGTISMDQAVLDVGEHQLSPGEPVVLLGDPAVGEPGLADWADALDTIEQEILTGLGGRVERIEDGGAWLA